MKMPKSIIYKPSVNYSYSQVEKTFSESSSSLKFSLKQYLKEIVIKILIFLLIFLNFSFFIAVSYKGYMLFRFKIEKRALEKENKGLKEEYKKLTSQEVLLEKAKSLGLRVPQKEDYLRVEK